MTATQRIDAFLSGGPHAVVGASPDRGKYGNRVLRAYVARGMPVFPVHPTAEEVEGLKAFPSLSALPEAVHGVSVVTPPAVTEEVIREAGRLGIRRLWLQPGAESPRAPDLAREAGVDLISGGPCVLVELGRR